MPLRSNLTKLFFLFFTLAASTGNAQDSESLPLLYSYDEGYKFIEKAKNFINAGEYYKAEKFLDMAARADYGFCGNAWSSANGEIGNTKAEIYIIQRYYNKALNTLETVGECMFGSDCATRDSLKIMALIGKYGKTNVRAAFNEASGFKKPDVLNYQYSVHLSSLNYTFKFENYIKIEGNIPQSDEDIKALMKKQKFYSLLE
ncbi:hypothetical protein Q765_02140 [Flavobacterium rivuli WB 3.3-2 = DSM 21788]|uniref:Uncharacterized protein n=1 Tax=Flavobacterium rivuli WB 3.3-2 = DSM 21788 TaxID=1121895 RepID=A0A0A2MK97_9FLAO|nr:hypothetical protein [Flavobacterium rivuli]KGO88720.1 hypothetical protein Q765_02140 [Flavobacterium rivuli WB 3.3-2 = DSM 21788]